MFSNFYYQKYTLEDETNGFSWNIGKELPQLAV